MYKVIRVRTGVEVDLGYDYKNIKDVMKFCIAHRFNLKDIFIRQPVLDNSKCKQDILKYYINEIKK